MPEINVLSQDKLRKIVSYNPKTGIFIYTKNIASRVKKGQIAGNIDSKGYLSFMIDGKRYRNHRLAYLYMYGYTPKIIDHINNNRQDNRISNLRPATQSQNLMNQPLKINNKSGFKGVSFSPRDKKWRAFITMNRKFISLGYYNDRELAVIARQKAENTFFQKFANKGN